ncbi:RdgB/HAM1 family non-canonical purine NTP pyrophosphatase [Pararhodobacter sp. CCB-MM2]|uniref:RdgB/HAM1 family non-canonical purine NTP pyrophosphatase n=1 Tax=Pararhodobacter sp. CCB-MM2 TaxID=1786003 RepID=UPI00082CFD4B|nr:RdgB/HAM1 family non-canonical purine NTP pyrophosphatase [Pararhodobacter sp. CCB-MM2]
MSGFPDTLLFATHNAGKVEEMRQLLSPYGVTVVSAKERGLAEPEETESTFVGNARIKAHAAAKATGLPALADDSGLCVDALGGMPGVWTADWAEGPDGRDFMRAMERTRAELGDTPAPWTAQFRCTLVMAWPDGRDEVYEGVVAGDLVWPVRGALGHGYDPMFVPEGEDRTFAEMTADEKNAMSHRARALKALIEARFT